MSDLSTPVTGATTLVSFRSSGFPRREEDAAFLPAKMIPFCGHCNCDFGGIDVEVRGGEGVGLFFLFACFSIGARVVIVAINICGI